MICYQESSLWISLCPSHDLKLSRFVGQFPVAMVLSQWWSAPSSCLQRSTGKSHPMSVVVLWANLCQGAGSDKCRSCESLWISFCLSLVGNPAWPGGKEWGTVGWCYLLVGWEVLDGNRCFVCNHASGYHERETDRGLFLTGSSCTWTDGHLLHPRNWRRQPPPPFENNTHVIITTASRTARRWESKERKRWYVLVDENANKRYASFCQPRCRLRLVLRLIGCLSLADERRAVSQGSTSTSIVKSRTRERERGKAIRWWSRCPSHSLWP